MVAVAYPLVVVGSNTARVSVLSMVGSDTARVSVLPVAGSDVPGRFFGVSPFWCVDVLTWNLHTMFNCHSACHCQ